MTDEAAIQSAKAVDISLILDEFKWGKDKYNKIKCPHPAHNDRTPSCSYMAGKNKFRCFGCGKSFDTIDLYRCLSEKVNGRTVPFYKAVEEVLELGSIANGNTGNTASSGATNTVQGNNSCQNICRQGNSNNSPYEMIIRNSKPLTGYELNNLHARGIMLYDSFVYGGKVHTAQSIDKALQTETDQNEINRLKEIRSNGTFYKGISHILKANRIQIKHNFWQGVNSIIYLVDYEAGDCDDLCSDKFFMDTERHMAIQKSLDGNHTKRALGTSGFNFITQGFENSKNKDIYICEGIEDALTYAMNGFRSISLNSIANLKSLICYLTEGYVPCHKDRFILSLDHDERGETASEELKQFFEAYNQNPSNRYKYSYAVCDYPKQFKDINDYWVSRVFQKNSALF